MRLILPILLLFITPFLWADVCNWQEIEPQPDGTYKYSAELNRCVGKLYASQKNWQEINDLQEQRIELWQKKAWEFDKKLTEWEKWSDANKYAAFGVGVIFTGASVWLAGRVYGK
jgi:hypothetical protein